MNQAIEHEEINIGALRAELSRLGGAFDKRDKALVRGRLARAQARLAKLRREARAEANEPR